MPLSALQPLVTQRFHEIDALLASILSSESSDARTPDSLEVRILRGLFFVHLYAAFEYSIDQSFIRLAQYISARNVSHLHLHRPILSVAMDSEFSSVQNLYDWIKKYNKRIDIIQMMDNAAPVSVQDAVLSSGMQSLNSKTLALAFDAYGIGQPPFVDAATKTYVDEVVSKRHAVAHGRESPTTYGNQKVADLRKRYDALYNQTTYVMDTLSNFLISKQFIGQNHRAIY